MKKIERMRAIIVGLCLSMLISSCGVLTDATEVKADQGPIYVEYARRQGGNKGDYYEYYEAREILVPQYLTEDSRYASGGVYNDYYCVDYNSKFWVRSRRKEDGKEVIVQTDMDQNIYQVCEYADAVTMIHNDEGEDVYAFKPSGNSYERGGHAIVSTMSGHYADSLIGNGKEFIIQPYYAAGKWWFLLGEISETYNSFSSILRIKDINGNTYWERNVNEWIRNYSLKWDGDIREFLDVVVVDRNHEYNVIKIQTIGDFNAYIDVDSGEEYCVKASSSYGWVDGDYLCIQYYNGTKSQMEMYEIGKHNNLLSGKSNPKMYGYLGEGIFVTIDNTFMDSKGREPFKINNVDVVQEFYHGMAPITVINSVGNVFWGMINSSGKFVYEPVPGACWLRYYNMGEFCYLVFLEKNSHYEKRVLANEKGDYFYAKEDCYSHLFDGTSYYYLYVKYGEITAEKVQMIYGPNHDAKPAYPIEKEGSKETKSGSTGERKTADFGKKNSTQKDTSAKDSTQKDTSKKDSSKKDTAKTETTEDIDKTASSRQNIAKRNAARKNLDKKNTGNNDSGNIEPQDVVTGDGIITDIYASSVFKKYDPKLLVDNDPATAWFEGVDGIGIGETLTFTIDADEIYGVSILPGYTKNEKVYAENGVPNMLFMESGKSRATIDLSGFKPDFNGLQPFVHVFDEPFIVENGSVRVMIIGANKGTKSEHVGISELHFFNKENNGKAPENKGENITAEEPEDLASATSNTGDTKLLWISDGKFHMDTSLLNHSFDELEEIFQDKLPAIMYWEWNEGLDGYFDYLYEGEKYCFLFNGDILKAVRYEVESSDIDSYYELYTASEGICDTIWYTDGIETGRDWKTPFGRIYIFDNPYDGISHVAIQYEAE